MNKIWVFVPVAGVYLGVSYVTTLNDLPLWRQDDPAHESPEPKGVPAPIATAMMSGVSTSAVSFGQTFLGHVVEGVIGEEAYFGYPPPAACERLLHSEQAAIPAPGDVTPKPGDDQA